MPNENFCKHCKHYRLLNGGVSPGFAGDDEFCIYEDNIKRRDENGIIIFEADAFHRHPNEINKNFDCEWFEKK